MASNIGYIEKQTRVLAQMYEEEKALRVVTNFNSVVNAVFWCYLVIVGASFYVTTMVFLVFLINSIWFFSHWMTKERTVTSL